ncbi:MAG: type 4b pilus protein PilO2 [Alcaligenaceae bacterium]|nr:type 4b pilus protein PilO2 [Alcaligenaceae bacterium]
MDKPLIVDVQGAQVAFGLDWFPLVGAHPTLIARELARRHDATHRVLSGRNAAAVGLARFPAGYARHSRLWSGAQVFAQMYATGTVAAVVDLDGQGWCVLAAHEGAVLARADKIHEQFDEACRTLDTLKQAYPKLRRLGAGSDADPAPSLAQLASAVSDIARLDRVRHHWLRRTVLSGGLVLGVILFGPRLATLYAGGIDPEVVARTPRQAWAEAQDAVLRKHHLPGEAGARVLLNTLYDLPVTVDGWSLRQVRCTAQGAGAACQADYTRVAPRADNRGLLQGARPGWQVHFLSVDQARIDWFLSLDTVLASQAELPNAAHHEANWVSALQAIRPAFTRVQVDPPRPLPIAAPRGPDSSPVARPSGLPRHATRVLRIAGPLRAANLLIPLSKHVSWNRAVLSVAGPQAGHAGSGPLNLTLDGVLYEIQDSRA